MTQQVEPPEDGFDTATILEHLNEVRIRLMWAFAGVAVGTLVTVFFAEELINLLTTPFRLYLTDGNLVAIRPTETLEIYFKTALVSGAIITMPWLLIQLWLFISPGLLKHEKRYVYVFVPAATLLFATGVLFAWYILLPPAVSFLSTVLSETVTQNWTLDEVIDFITSFIFWLGVSFEMPLIVYFLARVGIVTAKVLREQWRFAIIGIAVLAAIITPSVDPITMLLTMAPLLVLYLFSILMARLGYRHFERRMAVE
jgi:sec-independent protein translocase protein TatC